MTEKIILFAVATIIVFLILLYSIRSQAKKQGMVVERQNDRKAIQSMGKKLKRMSWLRHWKVLSGVSLDAKKYSCNIDYLIVAPFGLLALTVHGDKGEVYATQNDENWLHVNGPTREYLPNLMEENRVINDSLRWILSTEKIYKVPIYTLAVFTDPKVEIYLPTDEQVVKKKKFRKELKKPVYQSELDIARDAIVQAVEKYRKENK